MNYKKHYAHSLHGQSIDQWEPLEEHLRLVAEGDNGMPGASGFASKFGATELGRLAGLLHDVGKTSDAFQRYLAASNDIHDASSHCSDTSGKVDHSTAGAQLAMRWGPPGRLLAYCIAGHHGGLPDNEGERSCLSQRLRKTIAYDNGLPILQGLSAPQMRCLKADDHGFSLAFFTRMLFSCLVDADFLATESFMNQEKASQRPHREVSLETLLDQLNRYIDKIQQSPNNVADHPVNRQRRRVLSACREKAQLPPGLFSLNVPTGGGKTLSSLAFALTHAIQHDLDRVIYAIPFTSIIEQTAEVFREAMEEYSQFVLEHHSNLEPDDPDKQSERSRLAAENFDAPLIVTTNVQLFESLFASRTSRCRKLHRLARSVIILDEAQTLPTNLLKPTLAALKELAINYGSTIVLCTATQPAVEHRAEFEIGLRDVRPIIDDPHELHGALRRTHIECIEESSVEALADQLRKERKVLCIVNSRKQAAEIYQQLGDDEAIHLSASMCAAHRTDTIKTIRERLDPKSKKTCRVISTQVIEAGVDVDFPVVYRAAAGLDSIAQAAGRCNREGRLIDEHGRPRLGRVIVFDYDTTIHRPPPFIRLAMNDYGEVAPDHTEDLLSPAAIEDYFELHYWKTGGEGGKGWDKGSGNESIMNCFRLDRKVGLHAQFRTANDRYRMIEDNQTSVLVPYDEKGRKLIRELERMGSEPTPQQLRYFDRRAQRYIVGVHEKDFRQLDDQGKLLNQHERFYLNFKTFPKAYHKKLGLSMEPEILVL